MKPPEKSSPETGKTFDRISTQITDLVSNIAVKRSNLPPLVSAVVYDRLTNERFLGLVGIEYSGPKIARVITTTSDIFPLGRRLLETVDTLLIAQPNAPLLCDEKIAEELSAGTLTFVQEEHYRLEGRPGGVLEVLTPYVAEVTRTPDPDLKIIQFPEELEN